MESCLHYRTKVTLANGTREGIGKLVHARNRIQVLTMNERTGKVEAKTITRFHRNKMDDDHWIIVQAEGGRNGRRMALAAPDQPFFTTRGQIQAKDLIPGDSVLTIDRRFYTEEQHELILGSILGDGQLRFEKDGAKGHLRLTHGHKQTAYCQWKAEALGTKANVGKLHSWADSERSLEFDCYRRIRKFKALLSVPADMIAKITPRIAAIWYLDDGTLKRAKKYGHGSYSIYAKKLSFEQLEMIANHFDKIGMGRPTVNEGRGLVWHGERSERFERRLPRSFPSAWDTSLAASSTFAATLCRFVWTRRMRFSP
jgi:LAGLIDADG DNA endonuclease family